MSDDRLGYGDAEERVTDEAVIGEDEILCFTPCHRRAIRLDASEFERWECVAVTCPRCSGIWTVQFPEPEPGHRSQAVWSR
jgi:dissimilatory sulfite reductase (desulfoviridin) alpha/beta subunit